MRDDVGWTRAAATETDYRPVRLIRTQNQEPECADGRFRFNSIYLTIRDVLKIQGNNDMKSSRNSVSC